MKNLQPRELREAVGCGETLRFGSCQGGKQFDGRSFRDKLPEK